VEIEKKPKNAEFLALQASQHFRISKKLLPLVRFVSPIEKQGGLFHRKGTRKT
jgi:hypothetical protein